MLVSAALQAQLGFVAALMQAGDAGGFFENGSARERLLADEQADLALPHEGGRGSTRRGVGEEQLHVALAHVAAVDAIDGARFALDAPRNLDRVVFVVAAGGGAVLIVDVEDHFGRVARGPRRRCRRR